jgi:glycosyltransferase involved in cell wall biosynthesis
MYNYIIYFNQMINILIYKVIQKQHLLKANIINTINMAQGFAQNDCNVSFYVKESIMYFFEDKFMNSNVTMVNNVDSQNINQYDIIYCRDETYPLQLITNKSYSGIIIIESHDINLSPDDILTLQEYDKLVFTSISPLIINKYNFNTSLLFPCSIDFDTFSNMTAYKTDMFLSDKFNITYCGHLYDYKGIPIIIEAAKILTDCIFHIIGGNNEDINRHKQVSPENIIYYGHKNYNEVPNYLYSSDLLLIPYNKRGHKFSPSNITSPIKLFEYLSVRKPVLCSDIIGIKNWVDSSDVYFYTANELNDFIEKITYIRETKNSEEYRQKISSGYTKAKYYSTQNKCNELLCLARSLMF